jgi:hypothetical protein
MNFDEIIIAQDENEVTLTISNFEFKDAEVLTLDYTDKDNPGAGAVYEAKYYKNVYFNHSLWLCPVTLFVFGSYPDKIYYK